MHLRGTVLATAEKICGLGLWAMLALALVLALALALVRHLIPPLDSPTLCYSQLELLATLECAR